MAAAPARPRPFRPDGRPILNSVEWFMDCPSSTVIARPSGLWDRASAAISPGRRALALDRHAPVGLAMTANPSSELRLLCRDRSHGHIVQDRAKPALHFSDVHALARRIIFDLVALDLGDPEIMRIGMSDINPGD